MKKSYKFRIYPNNKQKRLIEKTFGCCRFIYNYFLDKRIKLYEIDKQSISDYDMIREITQLKKQYLWLKIPPIDALQQVVLDLCSAYNNFFRRVRNGENPGFPKFKSKKNSKKSYREYYSKVDFENSTIQLLKVKKVKIRGLRKFEGKISQVTVSKTPTNKYYVNILVEDNNGFPVKICDPLKTVIGIDLGIKNFMTLSDNRKFILPSQKENYKVLDILQYRSSKKQKGSKNKEKAYLKVAKQYEKIANIKKDFLHKLSHQLTHENQVKTIVVEDLNVQGMVKNRCLAKSIHQSSWSEFIRQLKYKSDWYGLNFIQIGRFEPTSKTCSNCGCINKNLTLSDRTWTCNKCHTILDRDINAAINIRNTGLGRPSELVEMSSSN